MAGSRLEQHAHELLVRRSPSYVIAFVATMVLLVNVGFFFGVQPSEQAACNRPRVLAQRYLTAGEGNYGRPPFRTPPTFNASRTPPDSRAVPLSLPAPDRRKNGPKMRGCAQPQPQPVDPRPPFPPSQACEAFLGQLGLRAARLRNRATRELLPIAYYDYLYDHLYRYRGPLSTQDISGRLAVQLWFAEEIQLAATNVTLRNYAGRFGGARYTKASIEQMTTSRGLADRLFEYALRRGCSPGEMALESFDLETGSCEQFIRPSSQEELLARMRTRWIHKPSIGRRAGTSIRSFRWFRRRGCRNLNGIAQRYMTKPLLLDGRKFELRSFLLIASLDPFVVFYKHGYLRVALEDYNPRSKDTRAHFTTTRVQNVTTDCETLVHWQSPRQLTDYLVKTGQADSSYDARLVRQCKEIALAAFRSIRPYFHQDYRTNRFMLMSLDFQLDETLRPYLMSINYSPPCTTSASAFMFTLMTEAAKEKIDIVSEISLRLARNMPLRNLCTPRTYEMLLNEDPYDQYEFVPMPKCVGS